MNNTLVVLMDLGRFKAFRLEESAEFSTPRLVTLEDRTSSDETRLAERRTDSAGQFSKGSKSFAAVNDMSNGERLHLDLESRRRAIHEFARFADEVLEREPLDKVYFAAGSEINQQVLDALAAPVRERITKNVKANLTKLPVPEILHHFKNGHPA